jgi:hypothetical protein
LSASTINLLLPTRRHQRVEHQRHVALCGYLLEQASAQGRLSGAHFTGELDEAARSTLPNAVQQVRERIPVGGTEIHKRGIRRDREWWFVQSKVLQVQNAPSIQPSSSSRLALPPTAAVFTVSVRSVANRNK